MAVLRHTEGTAEEPAETVIARRRRRVRTVQIALGCIWILEHLNLLRVAGIAVAALVLLFGGNLTGWGLLVIVIVLAVYLGLLQLVAIWARRVASPTAGSHPA